jgi:hypothetical protein
LHATSCAQSIRPCSASPGSHVSPDSAQPLVDGNYVLVHVFQDINGGQARWVTTDPFDTDDSDKIIEHWDVIAAYVDESANGHTQIDGPTEITDEDKTEDNKALVASFIDDVLVNHSPTAASSDHSSTSSRRASRQPRPISSPSPAEPIRARRRSRSPQSACSPM